MSRFSLAALFLVGCPDGGLPGTEPDPSGFPLFEGGTTTNAHILGDPDADLLAGGLAGDSSDNLYFSGNANEWSDGFSENFAAARQNSDGTLGWAKEWSEEHEQLQTDAGQNGSTGGTASSITTDGDGVYAVFHRSQASTNNTFQSVLTRIAPADGAMVWARGFSPDNVNPPALAWHSSDPYAVDASLPDRVLVAGAVLGNAEVLLFAVSKADGSLIWSKQLDIVDGSNDRAHALSIDASGNAWLGGASDGRGFLAKVSGVDGAAPALEFVNRLDMGTGSHVNHLVADGTDVFASFDIRGVDTVLAFGCFASDGSLTWAKSYHGGAPGDRNNTYVVRPDGSGGLFVGGRIGVDSADEQFGDGLLLRVQASDGAYDWGAFYYTGKNGDEVVDHRVKGVHIDSSGDLRMLLASHAVSDNYENYDGNWFRLMNDPLADDKGDGSANLADYSVPSQDVTANADLHDSDNAYNGTNVGTLHEIDTSGIWRDAPQAVTYGTLEDRTGNGVDGDAVILHLDLN